MFGARGEIIISVIVGLVLVLAIAVDKNPELARKLTRLIQRMCPSDAKSA